MRDRTFKPHDAFSVGEVFNAKDEELPDFIGNNGYFSSMFDFNETIFGGSEKAGTIAKKSHLTTTSAAVLRHRPKWGISDSFPILSRIMTSLAVSVTIFQKVIAVIQAKNAGGIEFHASWTSLYLSGTGAWHGKYPVQIN